MGLRDNFKQAARELLPGGEAEEPARPLAAGGDGSAHVPSDELGDLGRPVAERPVPGGAPRPPEPLEEDLPPAQRQRTLIAANTTIQGTIQGADGVDLYGEWVGDIEIKEDLRLYGKLDGNASGREALLCRGRVRGDLSMTGHIRLDRESMVLGNIRAGSLDLGGKVKGDLDVRGSLVLESDAVVLGNVTAANLAIAEGAVIQGKVMITAKDTDKLFQFPDFGPAGAPRSPA